MALAARGYTVISIPWWKWDRLKGAKEQQQYLQSVIGEVRNACCACLSSVLVWPAYVACLMLLLVLDVGVCCCLMCVLSLGLLYAVIASLITSCVSPRLCPSTYYKDCSTSHNTWL